MHRLLNGAVLGASMAVITMSAIPLHAQVTTADIIGRVEDAQGAVIPNAKVTIAEKGTGLTRSGVTTSSGDYSFTLLPPGQYTIRVEAAGFSTFVASNMNVSTGDRARVDAQLKLGEASETIEVNTSSVVLQTDSSAVQSTVDQTATQDLPLNGRNFFNLVTVQPGVNSGPPAAISSGTRPTIVARHRQCRQTASPISTTTTWSMGWTTTKWSRALSAFVRPSTRSPRCAF